MKHTFQASDLADYVCENYPYMRKEHSIQTDEIDFASGDKINAAVNNCAAIISAMA